nr:Glycosyl phosphatidyl inositol protein transamidase complex subunit [Polyrhizophydium stewartii]
MDPNMAAAAAAVAAAAAAAAAVAAAAAANTQAVQAAQPSLVAKELLAKAAAPDAPLRDVLDGLSAALASAPDLPELLPAVRQLRQRLLRRPSEHLPFVDPKQMLAAASTSAQVSEPLQKTLWIVSYIVSSLPHSALLPLHLSLINVFRVSGNAPLTDLVNQQFVHAMNTVSPLAAFLGEMFTMIAEDWPEMLGSTMRLLLRLYETDIFDPQTHIDQICRAHVLPVLTYASLTDWAIIESSANVSLFADARSPQTLLPMSSHFVQLATIVFQQTISEPLHTLRLLVELSNWCTFIERLQVTAQQNFELTDKLKGLAAQLQTLFSRWYLLWALDDRIAYFLAQTSEDLPKYLLSAALSIQLQHHENKAGLSDAAARLIKELGNRLRGFDGILVVRRILENLGTLELLKSRNAKPLSSEHAAGAQSASKLHLGLEMQRMAVGLEQKRPASPVEAFRLGLAAHDSLDAVAAMRDAADAARDAADDTDLGLLQDAHAAQLCILHTESPHHLVHILRAEIMHTKQDLLWVLLQHPWLWHPTVCLAEACQPPEADDEWLRLLKIGQDVLRLLDRCIWLAPHLSGEQMRVLLSIWADISDMENLVRNGPKSRHEEAVLIRDARRAEWNLHAAGLWKAAAMSTDDDILGDLAPLAQEAPSRAGFASADFAHTIMASSKPLSREASRVALRRRLARLLGGASSRLGVAAAFVDLGEPLYRIMPELRGPFTSLHHQAATDEKALLVGQVNRYFGYGDMDNSFHVGLGPVLWGDGMTTLNQSELLATEFDALGFDVSVQDFTFLKEDEYITGHNVHGILRAPRGDGTEAMVLAAPMTMHDGEPNANGIRYLLGLAKFLRRYSFWSKDIIFVVTTHQSYGVHSWLEAYHGFEPTHRYLLDFGPLSSHAGSLVAALCLEFPGTEDYTRLGIYPAGVNGLLPNADLVVTVIQSAQLAQPERLPLELFDTIMPHATTFWQKYIVCLRRLWTFVKIQASGLPQASHALFLKYKVEAMTLRGLIIPGSTRPVGMQQVASLIETSLRSLNNLLEKLHHSYWFYFMPSPEHFMPISVYIAPIAILAASVILASVGQWLESPTADPKADTTIDRNSKWPYVRRIAGTSSFTDFVRPLVLPLVTLGSAVILGIWLLSNAQMLAFFAERNLNAFIYMEAGVIGLHVMFSHSVMPFLHRLFYGSGASTQVSVPAWKILRLGCCAALGMILFVLTAINPSLAILIALPYVPLMLLIRPTENPALRHAQTVLLNALSPPGVLILIVIASGGSLQVLRDVKDMIRDWRVFGSQLMPIIGVLIWPLSLAAQTLVQMEL